jgi:hypothetical protein
MIISTTALLTDIKAFKNGAANPATKDEVGRKAFP